MHLINTLLNLDITYLKSYNLQKTLLNIVLLEYMNILSFRKTRKHICVRLVTDFLPMRKDKKNKSYRKTNDRSFCDHRLQYWLLLYFSVVKLIVLLREKKVRHNLHKVLLDIYFATRK